MQGKSSSSVRVYFPKQSKEKIILLLKERVKNLSKEIPIQLFVLFGSYAAGRHTAASDVDVFAVIESEHKNEAYKKILESLDIDNLQLHLYTANEYEKLKTNRPSFVKEVVEKGILIFET